jgi:hypothetical protein
VAVAVAVIPAVLALVVVPDKPVAAAVVAVTPAAMAFAATLEKSVAMESAQSLQTTVGVLT